MSKNNIHEATGSGVKVLGQVKDGKLVLDSETLKRIGGADGANDYRPVNAPFDPIAIEEALA